MTEAVLDYSEAQSESTSFRTMYLDLLEDALCFNLWPEPLHPMDRTAAHGLAMSALKSADKLLRRVGLALAIVPKQHPTSGTFWPAAAHTMIGQKRLRNIRELCEVVDHDGVPGAFVECGVWRGGASMYARACLDSSRKVICCDSFEGLPFDASEPQYCAFDALKVSLDEVRRNFENFGLLDNVEFVKGWFAETLGTVPGPIAILRADGDMFSSTIQILSALEPLVSPGGYIIIDDWCLPMCRRAVEIYRRTKQVEYDLVAIDGCGVYWRKGNPNES